MLFVMLLLGSHVASVKRQVLKASPDPGETSVLTTLKSLMDTPPFPSFSFYSVRTLVLKFVF